ncbi:hypothetical protein J5N97_009530 [Dioscorea zingiberensis]|uniref:Uncharacterized protein n=1 Tax=Dioscorea zingiberensis TaxID=325984 RepID=A0A9D5CWL1_9LILI|nr:hypothetical protein J5N97_009530 [Dioscorea zingiberensis]
MSPSALFLLLICICSFSVCLPALSAATPTAYEVLESYGLPIGLLPRGALGYELDPASGAFKAYLNGSCAFSIRGSYELRYQSTIAGRISQGKLRSLKGVSVKFLLFWIGIVEVDRRGDQLEFSVGIASANFGVDNFEECPQCGVQGLVWTLEACHTW